MIQSADAFSMNLAFAGKGNSSLPEGLEEQIVAGACSLKLHEDWGTTLVQSIIVWMLQINLMFKS